MNSTERDLPEHASRDEDYKRIWLSPACDDERTWCQDDQGPCDECGAPSVEYVRADALASIRAERDMAERAAVEAAIPLEALLMAGQGPLSDAVWDGVRNGVGHVRSMLKARAARTIAGEQTNDA